uniref:Uncharacterized protein n=1 Tax=Caenorhabditis japonica TaxID=281687 RepID=A0A8R1I7P9_CAEJA
MSSSSSIKILFEQIEPPAHHILSDCDLQCVTIRYEEPMLPPKNDVEEKNKKIEKKLPILYRDQKEGTDVETTEKCVGPSTLKVNVATKYEFQKLNATQAPMLLEWPIDNDPITSQ